jgi:porphobilinogen synthase
MNRTPPHEFSDRANFPLNLRRKRLTPQLRSLFSTISIDKNHLIQPYFIYEDLPQAVELTSLRGQWRHNLPSLLKSLENFIKVGGSSVLLFIVPKHKAEENFDHSFDELVISTIKKQFGRSLIVFTDICLCSQTHTGHCGLFTRPVAEIEGAHQTDHPSIDNDASVKALVHKALCHARAGADVLSPSDMMDDRILAIRQRLDSAGLSEKLIMSYSTKFSSNLYGPFREAAESTPQFGDRKTYQISPTDPQDALSCSVRDAAQGADILMVKPATFYLDMLYQIKHHPQTSHLPLCAYQVSGEYQSLHLMEQAGFLKFEDAFHENLIAIKRSGADLIITYGAMEYIKNQK